MLRCIRGSASQSALCRLSLPDVLGHVKASRMRIYFEWILKFHTELDINQLEIIFPISLSRVGIESDFVLSFSCFFWGCIFWIPSASLSVQLYVTWQCYCFNINLDETSVTRFKCTYSFKTFDWIILLRLLMTRV